MVWNQHMLKLEQKEIKHLSVKPGLSPEKMIDVL